MLLPSNVTVHKHTPIYDGSNFTWGEATKNCTRQPTDLIIQNKLILTSKQIEKNIIQTARRLDRIREVLGNRPLWVNSWYRPKHINSRVGGGKYSRHQYGDAVDIRSNYLSPAQIFQLLDRLHGDGGLSRYFNFVHVDFRGHKARW